MLHIPFIDTEQTYQAELLEGSQAPVPLLLLSRHSMAVICRYNMTKFAMWSNEITPPGLDKKLAPTDCRLRPDQHALEEGIYDQVISFALPPSHDLCTADVSVYSLPDYHAWAPHHNLLMPLVLFTLLVLYMNNVFMACPCTVACCSMESNSPCRICEWDSVAS